MLPNPNNGSEHTYLVMLCRFCIEKKYSQCHQKCLDKSSYIIILQYLFEQWTGLKGRVFDNNVLNKSGVMLSIQITDPNI